MAPAALSLVLVTLCTVVAHRMPLQEPVDASPSRQQLAADVQQMELIHYDQLVAQLLEENKRLEDQLKSARTGAMTTPFKTTTDGTEGKRNATPAESSGDPASASADGHSAHSAKALPRQTPPALAPENPETPLWLNQLMGQVLYINELMDGQHTGVRCAGYKKHALAYRGFMSNYYYTPGYIPENDEVGVVLNGTQNEAEEFWTEQARSYKECLSELYGMFALVNALLVTAAGAVFAVAMDAAHLKRTSDFIIATLWLLAMLLGNGALLVSVIMQGYVLSWPPTLGGVVDGWERYGKFTPLHVGFTIAAAAMFMASLFLHSMLVALSVRQHQGAPAVAAIAGDGGGHGGAHLQVGGGNDAAGAAGDGAAGAAAGAAGDGAAGGAAGNGASGVLQQLLQLQQQQVATQQQQVELLQAHLQQQLRQEQSYTGHRPEDRLGPASSPTPAPPAPSVSPASCNDISAVAERYIEAVRQHRHWIPIVCATILVIIIVFVVATLVAAT